MQILRVEMYFFVSFRFYIIAPLETKKTKKMILTILIFATGAFILCASYSIN